MPAPVEADDVQRFLTEHRVLQSIHAAITDAVRVRAENPLLHMAKLLREAHAKSLPSAPKDELVAAEAVTDDFLALPAEVDGPLQVVDVRSERQLEELLLEAGLDLGAWGDARAERLAGMWQELHERAAVLCRTQDGVLRRAHGYLTVELHHRGRVLVETHQEVDGRTAQKFDLPSTAVRANEAWQSAVHRCIAEALQLGRA